MFNIAIKLVFGSNIFDVNAVFGAVFPAYESRGTYYVVGVKIEKDGDSTKEMSACRPGSHHVDVTYFVIGRQYDGASAKAHDPIDLTKEFVYEGPTRLSAGAAARQINIGLSPTSAAGECGIDAACFMLKKSRNADGWDTLRKEMEYTMEAYAHMPMWQQAFKACDEYDTHNDMPMVSKPDWVDSSLVAFPCSKSKGEANLLHLLLRA